MNWVKNDGLAVILLCHSVSLLYNYFVLYNSFQTKWQKYGKLKHMSENNRYSVSYCKICSFQADRSKAVVLMWSLSAVLVSDFRRCFTLCLFIIL